MDLRKELGKFTVEKAKHEQELSDRFSRHDAERNARWHAQSKAYAAGYRPPERRFLVLLNPYGPISSAEKLREFLDLPEVPEVFESRLIDNWEYGPSRLQPGDSLQLCTVNISQICWLYENTQGTRRNVSIYETDRSAWDILGTEKPERDPSSE